MAIADRRVRVVMAMRDATTSGGCDYAERIEIHNNRDACSQAIPIAIGQASDRQPHASGLCHSQEPSIRPIVRPRFRARHIDCHVDGRIAVPARWIGVRLAL